MSTSEVPVHGASPPDELRRNQLNLTELLFQSLGSAAPGLSVTLAVVVGANFAGASLSFALILATIGIVLVSVCIGQMAQHFPSAGGFYTYVAAGLHPAIGTLVAWLYLIVWVVFPSTLFLPFGNFLASTLRTDFGFPYTSVWILFSMVCIAMIYAFVYNGAKLSTKITVALSTIEITILTVLSAWFIIKAGNRNTLSVFGTSHANIKGFVGASGIFAAMVYAVYGFVGFENVVPMAEEAESPRRGVNLAAILSPLILGIFIIFCTYAATVFFGVGRFSSFTAFNNGNEWIGITKEVWHGGWYILLFALLNSCLASANGATNAGIRHMYAMGRIGLLPSVLSRVERKHGAPIVALVVLTCVSVGTTLAAGLGTGSPLEGFAFLGTIETAMAIVLYLMVCLACLVWFVRHRPQGFNPLVHVLVPILAIGVMVPALLAAIGVGSGLPLLSFVTPLTYPLNIAGYITLAWVIAGIGYAVYIWRKHPDRARRTEQIFVEEPSVGA